MKGRVLMVQGSSSSAGKSLLVTGLCHLFARRGVRVAPYKAQNMSNNAAVCPDGSEIGRAQANQAIAAGLDPHVDMNPILIKPEADARAQIVLMGKAWRTLSASDYYPRKDVLWKEASAALARLRTQYELVIIEGAGSPAELNLKQDDIVNMKIALHAQAPVLLVGDIDRGGIFAQLIGTVDLLEPEERELVKGLIVNKFRGDITLFGDGEGILEEKSGVPVLGVVPYLYDLAIPEEDAVALEAGTFAPSARDGETEIAVVHLPRIANFDDFDPLAGEAGVRVRYVDSVEQIGNPAAIIIPGTKSTMMDLKWMRAQGLAEAIQRHARAGGAVVGICGGYQMLGKVIRDPQHVESRKDEAPGLGLLPTETEFAGDKSTHQASARISSGGAWLARLKGQLVNGYEIHMGQTTGSRAWLEIVERNGQAVVQPDGAMSADGKVWGCYIHGLFANEDFRRAWLGTLGWKGNQASPDSDPFAASLTRLADVLEESLDMQKLEAIIWAN